MTDQGSPTTQKLCIVVKTCLRLYWGFQVELNFDPDRIISPVCANLAQLSERVRVRGDDPHQNEQEPKLRLG